MKTLRSLVEDKSLISKIIRDAKFFGKDPNLTRYSRHELKHYVGYCCERQYFIEAYSLTLQHTEDIIVYSLKRQDLLKSGDAPKVMAVLRNVGLISNEFYELFYKINNQRNKLVHEVIRNPEVRKRIANSKSHTEDLLRLIELAESFLLDWVKQHPTRFLYIKPIKELGRDDRIKQQLLTDIIGNIIAEEIDIPVKGLSREAWKVKFMQEFHARFKQKFLELFGVSEGQIKK